MFLFAEKIESNLLLTSAIELLETLTVIFWRLLILFSLKYSSNPLLRLFKWGELIRSFEIFTIKMSLFMSDVVSIKLAAVLELLMESSPV